MADVVWIPASTFKVANMISASERKTSESGGRRVGGASSVSKPNFRNMLAVCLTLAFIANSSAFTRSSKPISARPSLALQASFISRIINRIFHKEEEGNEEEIDIDIAFDDAFFAKMKNERRELKAESLFDKLASESPPPPAAAAAAVSETEGEEEEESLFKELHDGNGEEAAILSNNSDNSIENLLREKDELEYEYQRIVALEQRNEAQLESFVDEEAQWEALTTEEQALLNSKESVLSCLDSLKEVLRLLQK
jgi:hypothetical protein